MTEGKPTAIVVDDEQPLRELLADLLKSNGYSTLTAADGEEALKYFNNGRPTPHLLLTDVVMPKKRGDELIEALVGIQTQKPDFYVPVLIVTGRVPNEVDYQRMIENAKRLYNPQHKTLLEEKLKAEGMLDLDQFITLAKPFQIKEFIRRAGLIKDLYTQS